MVRRAVRKELHGYLDMMLKCQVQAPNGEMISMLDDLCIRATLGFGFAVDISCRHPDHPDAVHEVAPQDPPPLVRGPSLHGPHCSDPKCPGCAAPALEVVR
jgi:hypothetical protein